jgi:hypothetical protein
VSPLAIDTLAGPKKIRCKISPAAEAGREVILIRSDGLGRPAQPRAGRGAWLDVADIHRLRPDVLSGSKNPNPEAYLEDATYSEALSAFRAKLVFDRLREHGNSAFAAAASLKISGPTFYRYWMDAKRSP